MNVTKKLENFNCGENFMARRLMKKSMSVMMIWVMLTLVEVHTNDHAATSNYLVDPHIVEMKYINCFVYALDECYNNFKVVGNPVDFRDCAFAMLEACKGMLFRRILLIGILIW